MTSPPPRSNLAPSGRNLLTPEDAYYSSPPRAMRGSASSSALSAMAFAGGAGGAGGNGSGNGIRSSPSSNTSNSISSMSSRMRHTQSGTNLSVNGGANVRSRSRRRRQRDVSNSSLVSSSSASASRQWKKLLWIKQPYPDNYTDASTFLSHLQVNPLLQAYDFWPLVADSTVIVQHVCAVALFVCCFVGIYQKRISPVAVVGTATACSLVGWFVWDVWLSRLEGEVRKSTASGGQNGGGGSIGVNDGGDTFNGGSVASTGLGIASPVSPISGSASLSASKFPSRNQSTMSLPNLATTTATSSPSPMGGAHGMNGMNGSFHISSPSTGSPPVMFPPYPPNGTFLSLRNQQRLATAKSALLIYLALLGLSPILKSLTRSTTEDSIWAMSCWLLLTNIFTFDYGASSAPTPSRNPDPSTSSSPPAFPHPPPPPLLSSSPSPPSLSSSSPPHPPTLPPSLPPQHPAPATATASSSYSVSASSSSSATSSSTHFPASLSTNAALMASTVLASRLPSTTDVFSLTLFSIEVFGLFPVFRRALRARSFALHIALTVLLILASGAGLGILLIHRSPASTSLSTSSFSPSSLSSLSSSSFSSHSPLSLSSSLSSPSSFSSFPDSPPSDPFSSTFGSGSAYASESSASALNLLTSALLGALIWGLAAVVAMGGCSWWLIGLQRYKNVVIGPWDVARPVIRGGNWD